MLTLKYARACHAQQEELFREIGEQVRMKQEGQILLVPDQISHEMERQLCLSCGDSVSLYAEVLTISQLANRVLSETGGSAAPILDDGGRVLVMNLAFHSVASELQYYRGKEEIPDFLKDLLRTYDELESGMVRAEEFLKLSEQIEMQEKRKFHDLGLIFQAYDAFTSQLQNDPKMIYTWLIEQASRSSYLKGRQIYIYGFRTLTAKEEAVFEQLMIYALNVNLFLCMDSLEGTNEWLAPSRDIARRLIRYCERYEIPYTCLPVGKEDPQVSSEIHFLEKYVLEPGEVRFPDNTEAVSLFSAQNVQEECEYAAYRIRQLITRGYRYRDLSLAVRDFNQYRGVLKEIFQKYGIPFYEDDTSRLLDKPVIVLILSALNAIEAGYSYDTMFRYLRCGLSHVSAEEIDLIENYIYSWNIRGSLWTKDWTMSPGGIHSDMSPEQEKEVLNRYNEIRMRIITPLEQLKEETSKERTAEEMIRALYRFMQQIQLQTQIADRAQRLMTGGFRKQAEEYQQLWELLLHAMEQCYQILGSQILTRRRFSSLLQISLSQYHIGTIPYWMDCVNVGEAERLSPAGSKVLILLGCSEKAYPKLQSDRGLLTEEDREILNDQGFRTGVFGQSLLEREMNLVYYLLTAPSEMLILSYSGNQKHDAGAAFFYKKIAGMFPHCKRESVSMLEGKQYTAAVKPALEYALTDNFENPSEDSIHRSLQKIFEDHPDFKRARNYTMAPRNEISSEHIRQLFGDRIHMSASTMNRYQSCRFSFLMQYGLKLEPREKVSVDAPESGTYIHYILEKTVQHVVSGGMLPSVSREEMKKIIRSYTDEYVRENLHGLEDKSVRFQYLFKRLCQSAVKLVESVLDELKNSDFSPLDYELKFGGNGALKPVEILSETQKMFVQGIVDRVDGYEKDSELYLRVVDYKTGKKTFNLTDIWNGLNIQMLLYLFALEEDSRNYFGREIKPAGVLYIPVPISPKSGGNSGMTREEQYTTFLSEVRRNGLLLNEGEILEAMEHSEGRKRIYLPVQSSGTASSDSLATLEQFGKVKRHIQRLLKEIAENVGTGQMQVNPYQRGPQENACQYCPYVGICQFDETNGKDQMRYLKSISPEDFWNRLDEKEKKHGDRVNN